MQAIILAAGMGRRLKELTQNNTKCMVKVNGVTLIDRMLNQIEAQHLSRIVIVIGYEGKKLIDYISTLNIQTPIIYVNNPIYDKTNNIYSLFLARDYLCQEDTLLFESDLIFEDSVIESLIKDPRDTLALVDKYESWMDGTCVKLADDDTIETFIPKKKFKFKEIDQYYKTVNIYKFSKHFSATHYIPFLEAYSKALGNNEYYEQVLRVITMLDEPEIKAKRLSGQRWYEIDDIQDLDIAESMFASDEDKRVELLQGRYGGYWRYPRLLDFCYLVNPYFPTEKMLEEIKASFDKLLTQYPSGMRVNSLLAALHFNVHAENIIVGNGAAELIKVLMEHLTGKIGIVRPTFEEYPNRYQEVDTVVYFPDNDNYSYTAEDLMNYFADKDINNLILINPDNPSGNYIPKHDLLKLIEWSEKHGINLIIDESFVDFSNEENSTVINQDILESKKYLYVMKSISKSYGVPGLRLGVLASGNKKIIAELKKEVSIWNINSFAEFYMQISEKYKKDYTIALKRMRAERIRYIEELSKIEALRIIPSQANYLMVEITNGMSAAELTRRLILKHNILIKNLFSKINHDGRQYIRLAIRCKEENDRLIEALKEELAEVRMNFENGTIEDLFNSGKSEIVVFGTSNIAMAMMKEVDKLGKCDDIIYFVDNDRSLWGKSLYFQNREYQIKEPSCLERETKDFKIVIASTYVYDIAVQLGKYPSLATKNCWFYTFMKWYPDYNMEGYLKTAGQLHKKYEDQTDKFIQLKDSHIGERCFIIGNGPSLTMNDLELLTDEFCFGTNQIFFAFDKTSWRPDVYLTVNVDTFLAYRNVIDTLESKIKFIDSKALDYGVEISDAIYLKHGTFAEGENIFSRDISQYYYNGGTVVYTALQIAVYMGFKDIYLIGCDNNFTIEKSRDGNIIKNSIQNHFYTAEDDKKTANLYATVDVKHLSESFEIARDYAEKNGIQIYNATRGGKLEVFPRVRLEEVVGQ